MTDEIKKAEEELETFKKKFQDINRQIEELVTERTQTGSHMLKLDGYISGLKKATQGLTLDNSIE